MPSVAAVRRIERVSPPLNADPASVTIGASLSSIPNDGTTTSLVTVSVVDKNGNPVSGATVVATCTNPSNTTLSSPAVTSAGGSTTFTITSSAAGTVAHIISITANGIAMTNTVTVTSTGANAPDATKTTLVLSAATVVNGSAITATVTAKDAAGNPVGVGGATVVLSASGGTATVSLSNSGTPVDNGDDTYVDTITGTGAGTATTISGTINGTAISGNANPTLTVTSGGGANPTPDIAADQGFEGSGTGGYGPMTNWSYSTPSATSPRTIGPSTEQHYAGNYAVKTTIVSTTGSTSDYGTQFVLPYVHKSLAVAQDRLRWRMRFYPTNLPSAGGIWKFNILEDATFSYQFCGVYCISNALRVVFPEYLKNGISNSAMPIVSSYASLLNQWNSLEVDYIRNGHASGNPAMGVWLNGTKVVFGSPPNGGAVDAYGYVDAGSRTNGPGSYPLTASKLGILEFAGVLNFAPSNSNSGSIYWDDLSVSTLGNIDATDGAP